MQLQWHILGAGAIGCLWASHLAGNGRDVHLLLSPRHAPCMEKKLRVRLTTTDGEHKRVAVSATTAGEYAAPVRNLIVSTKATQVLDALDAVSDHIIAGARIILLLNGMGYQRVLLERFSSCKVFAAVTTDGAWLEKPFCVVHAGRGVTTLGPLSASASHADCAALLQDLKNPGLHMETTREIEKTLLEKVMINAAINGLTAIYRCRNGGLLEIPAARAQLQPLVQELQHVVSASGEEQLARRLPARVEQVIRQTADNFSSTYQDIERKRGSEIAFINGYVVGLGDQLGINTPCNQAIVEAIAQLEAGRFT